MWEKPTGSFEVKPDNPWANLVWPTSELPGAIEPAYRTDEAKKKLFGIELAKINKPFEAACNVFGEDTNAAMWVSWNWLTDPIVIAAKDTYLETVGLAEKLLDKEQLSARLLIFANEKNHLGFYVSEAKDRLAALKLYAEVQGFIGKINIDASTNNFTNNEMKLLLVPAPIKQEEKVIDVQPDHSVDVDNPLPIKLKLVNSR